MKPASVLRYIGSSLLVTGYIFLLWGDMKTALIIRIFGGASLLPFAISLRLWDVILLESFFITMDVTKFIQIIFLV